MKQGNGKRIAVSVTNDLVTDQRVHKVCSSLQGFGYEVTLVGRKLPKSLELRQRPYETRRMPLWFKKKVFFYAEYNIRLLFFLLRTRPDAVLSNDLDTLLANFIFSKMFKCPIYYDSHEYFTQVPELVDRPTVRKMWERMERKILPQLKHTYTVSSEVSKAYQEKYGIKMEVIRNFPRLSNKVKSSSGKFDRPIIIYQGVLNVQRGLEEAIMAMKYVKDAELYIVGGGDIEEELKSLTIKESLGEKVKFLGQLPFEKLQTITARASMGLSIEKPVGLNYQMALPNKLFDYIHAEIPVLVSPLVEVKKVLAKYRIGEVLESHDPKHIADKINFMLNDAGSLETWKTQLKEAKQEYCWENEEEKLKQIYQPR